MKLYMTKKAVELFAKKFKANFAKFEEFANLKQWREHRSIS
jgi:hypothetical protein